ncbi:MAG: hypothetical protein IT535_00180 [Bauldia sp.]|nr:hypothetical protein [Bauldia sp.]
MRLLRRVLLALVLLLLLAGVAVAWRGFLRGERIFYVEDDSSWYVECTYQQFGGKLRTYHGGWYSRERAEADAWCPFVRR